MADLPNPWLSEPKAPFAPDMDAIERELEAFAATLAPSAAEVAPPMDAKACLRKLAELADQAPAFLSSPRQEYLRAVDIMPQDDEVVAFGIVEVIGDYLPPRRVA